MVISLFEIKFLLLIHLYNSKYQKGLIKSNPASINEFMDEYIEQTKQKRNSSIHKALREIMELGGLKPIKKEIRRGGETTLYIVDKEKCYELLLKYDIYLTIKNIEEKRRVFPI